MAVHVGPLALLNPLISLSKDDWSELARLSGVCLSDEHRTKILKSTQRYIEQAVSHAEGAPRGDVIKVIKNIRNACEEFYKELKILDQICFDGYVRNKLEYAVDLPINKKEDEKRRKKENEHRAYRIVNRLISESYWNSSRNLIDFNSIILDVMGFRNSCDLAELYIEKNLVSDEDLSIYIYRLSIIFSEVSKKRQNSLDSLEFIYLLCTKIVRQLKDSATPETGYEADTFYNFRSVTNKSFEDSSTTIKWRIKEGAKASRIREKNVGPMT